MDSPSLETLADAYAEAKRYENEAVEYRRDLAAQIAELTRHSGEGSKTYATESGWKVAVKAPLIRSMDWLKWETVKQSIPAEFHPVEMKPSLDEKGVKWLEANEPALYAILATALTVKPGALQVTVTPPKDKDNGV